MAPAPRTTTFCGIRPYNLHMGWARLSWRWSIARTMVLAIALADSSCTGGGQPGVAASNKPEPASIAALRKLPEDHIFFPGPSTIGETEYSATGIDSGGASPDAGWIMGTSAPQADVLGLYDQRGWQRDDAGVFRGTGETLVAGWRKQQYMFRLAFSRPGDVGIRAVAPTRPLTPSL